MRAWRNDAGRFGDASAGWGFTRGGGAVGAVSGDVDGDARADVVVVRDAGVSLFRNGPDGRFSQVTGPAGLGSAGRAQAAALGDFDHDGDLDLVLGGADGADRLFQNTGAAVFKEVPRPRV